MIIETTLITPQMLSLVPVVMALVSLSKMYLSARWAPLVSILLGVAGAFIMPAVSVPLTVLGGVIIGLTASGLYSQGKTVLGG